MIKYSTDPGDNVPEAATATLKASLRSGQPTFNSRADLGAAESNVPLNEGMAAQPAAFVSTMAAIATSRDHAAFAQLFRYFAPRVMAYLISLGSNNAVAEDLMQDVMLTVWRRAETYNPALASVATWLLTIARNRRIDVLRSGRRSALDTPDATLRSDPPALPDEATAARQWEESLRDALRALPPEQSQVLRLAYHEDRTHRDISQRLNVPVGTVKSRLRLAIARLRSKFEELAIAAR